MKILITGSNGMLGTDFKEVLKNEEIIATDSKSLDITDKKLVSDCIKKHKPDLIINSAAYTDVDGCETNKNLAFKVNGEAVKNLALLCKEMDIGLVHISTDYVFDGKNDRPWREDDEVNPISVYGKSKLEGEIAIQENIEKFFIIRTAWLYGVHGKSFPKTMLELSKNHNEISVVNDQFGTPTFTRDLALAISKLIKTNYYGIYHITNSGTCSWYEFAKLIFKLSNIEIDVKPVSTDEFPRPAPRPKYSVLANNHWTANNFEPLRDYKEAIKEFLNLIK